MAVINPRSSKKVFLESVRVYESRSIRESSLGTLFLKITNPYAWGAVRPIEKEKDREDISS